MKLIRNGTCGSLQSNDCLVKVSKNSSNENKIIIESIVKEEFGEEIQEVIVNKLNELDIESCIVEIEDKGALNFTISARVETAIRRAI
ncbi:citrate lyase acyl carrier protein [Miniphocaeibacter halophilus]|uniref:Citrate lyase acyl carrier protein n=1 Tax=Miniphocaeibacter halophilus TaxID=2931922 RepID=A0AC61MVQ5_9FIRM|nr:citrate lyase acyl carrier protein [Miniphocaeibacter halophilus]QQK08101.1 citrate lyase acyl carrier protein [Miniphocaeibacter halophilus]